MDQIRDKASLERQARRLNLIGCLPSCIAADERGNEAELRPLTSVRLNVFYSGSKVTLAGLYSSLPTAEVPTLRCEDSPGDLQDLPEVLEVVSRPLLVNDGS